MPKKNTEICCIFNLAPHYRSAIYKLMDEKLKCDFYFGDRIDTSIKIMNVNELSGYKKTVENINLFNSNKYKWQKGVIGLVFKNYKYYILTGDHSILSSWVIAFLAKFMNKKVYIWLHGLKSEKELHWKGKLRIYPFYKMSDKFLFYGDYSRSLMIQKGFDPQKMETIYNSLDYDKQIAIRKNLGKSNIYSNYFKNNLPVLFFIGRIQKAKKLDLVLIAMIILKQKGIQCNFVIVGEDADGTSFNKQIAEAGIESNVWIYGPCYDEEKIGELIYNADVCISPGNVGLTALHSFVYGTPLITHNNFETHGPEFEIVTPGTNGDFFEEDNVWDLADKITKWISLNEFKREAVRVSTYKIIDAKYNPHYQIKLLKKVLNIS
jgi:glycosyltransferase involved in cell wall biosynthesis